MFFFKSLITMLLFIWHARKQNNTLSPCDPFMGPLPSTWLWLSHIGRCLDGLRSCSPWLPDRLIELVEFEFSSWMVDRLSCGPTSQSRTAEFTNSSPSNGRTGSVEVVGIGRHGSRDLFDSARVSLASPVSTSLQPPKVANCERTGSSWR